MTAFYGMLGLMLVLAGGVLLSDPGAGSVPNALRPFANVWVKSGGSPKSFNAAMWVLFTVAAIAMLLFIGIPLYSAVNAMGRGFK